MRTSQLAPRSTLGDTHSTLETTKGVASGTTRGSPTVITTGVSAALCRVRGLSCGGGLDCLAVEALRHFGVTQPSHSHPHRQLRHGRGGTWGVATNSLAQPGHGWHKACLPLLEVSFNPAKHLSEHVRTRALLRRRGGVHLHAGVVAFAPSVKPLGPELR